ETAGVVTFGCEAGAMMGKAASGARQALLGYGQELGLALQIADDLAAIERAAGPHGKDIDRAKISLVSVLGRDRAYAQAQALVAQAATSLDMFDEKADLLRAAARFVIARRR